jgi:hypothetical protein
VRGIDRSGERAVPSAAIGQASAYMPVVIIVVDAPKSAKTAWVELIEPIEDIDMPVIELMPVMVVEPMPVMVVELMPVMVDAVLMVPDVDDAAGLPEENDIE